MVAFPEEILNQICWNLKPSKEHVKNPEQVLRRDALFNLLCCSKTFHRLAQPVLYHTLTVPFNGLTLQTLYQLCANDPSLALLVKEVDFGFFRSSSRPPAERSSPAVIFGLDLTPPPAEHLEIFSEGLRGDLLSLLEDCDPDAMIALLLVMCRNLTTLDLHTTHWPGSLVLRVVEEVISRPRHPSTPSLPSSSSSSSSLPLQVLHSFRTEHRELYTFQPLTAVQPILSLPSLRTFSGEAIVLPGWGEFPDPSGVSFSLRSLKLSSSDLNPDGLKWFLTSCPELREFELEFGLRDGISVRFTIGWDLIWEELKTHSKGLEKIVLGIKDDWNYLEDDILENLSGFAKLRVLHLEWEAIYGLDGEDESVDHGRRDESFLEEFLPTTLEEFVILSSPTSLDYMDFWDAQVSRVLRSDRFGSLSTIMMKREDKFTLELPLGWREYSTDVEAPEGIRAFRPGRIEDDPDSDDPQYEVSMRLVRER